MSDTHDVTISGFDLDRLERELAEAREQRDKLELWKATAQRLADRVVRQESELAAVKQTMGELCESCGWAMRLPDQPCRCELDRELADLKDSIANMSHPNIRDLLRELAEANEYATYEITQEVHGLREQRDVIMQRLSETHMRMIEAEKQRDRLADELADWHNAAKHVAACHPDEAHCGCVTILWKQITDALTQRDSLAEAMHVIVDVSRKNLDKPHPTIERVYAKAFDSVKGGTP
jgi:regulator of replication initiation timing